MGHYKTYPPPSLKVWTGIINFCQSPTYLMKQRMIDEEAIKLFSSTMVPPPDVQVILDGTPVNRQCSLGYIAGWSARESKNVSFKETTEQVEIATPTAPTGVADQIQPPGAIYPTIALLAGQLRYPPSPKPIKPRDIFNSDSN